MLLAQEREGLTLPGEVREGLRGNDISVGTRRMIAVNHTARAIRAEPTP